MVSTDEGQVQREQVTAGRMIQGQANPGDRVQTTMRLQRTISVASGNSVDQSMARFGSVK